MFTNIITKYNTHIEQYHITSHLLFVLYCNFGKYWLHTIKRNHVLDYFLHLGEDITSIHRKYMHTAGKHKK